MSSTRNARPEVKVRVIARSGRTAIEGMRGRNLTIVAGARSRDKRIAVEGLSAAQVQARLSAILQR